jgi:hypothetical protein
LRFMSAISCQSPRRMPCLEKVSSERFIRKYLEFYSFYDGVSTRSGYPLACCLVPSWSRQLTLA